MRALRPRLHPLTVIVPVIAVTATLVGSGADERRAEHRDDPAWRATAISAIAASRFESDDDAIDDDCQNPALAASARPASSLLTGDERRSWSVVPSIVPRDRPLAVGAPRPPPSAPAV